MKTEQERIEQIEKMAQAMCVFYDENKHCVARDDSLCSEVKCQCCGYKESAKRLIRAGYGDVSEYKAEIERLKDEIIYLERKIAIRDNALKDSDKAIEMLEGKQDTIVKQAKIDVLNKAKKCSCCDNFFPDGQWHRFVFVSDIDILIKRVENDK